MLIEIALHRSRAGHRSTRSIRSALSSGCLALLAFGAAAIPCAADLGAPGHESLDPSEHVSVWRESVGLQDEGACLLGSGPEYAVRFDPGGFTFVPALGASASGPQSLSFRLDSIHRGGAEVLRAGGKARPEKVGRTARYRRGSGVTEIYAVRPEGVEQSFAFERPLGTSGELVVRGRIATGLATGWSSETEAGLRFEDPGGGAVTIGEVLGIDADGATARGTLRLEGEWLELVLPASFVDAASWPLVLDPLIGTDIELETSTENHYNTDCAYDASTDTYLVVWQFEFTPGASSIRGQRIDGDTGDLVGDLVDISGPTGGPADDPRVASVNKVNRFLVVWTAWVSDDSEDRIKGRALNAGSSGMSGVVTIASPFGTSAWSPAVGGEANTTDNEALVAWKRSAGGIQARLVTVPSFGDPSNTGDVFFLTGELTANRPALPKSGGLAGRWLLTWQLQTPLPDLQHDVLGRVVARDGTLLTNVTELAASSLQSESAPAVDGDGESFVVVWQEIDDAPGSDYDIAGRRFVYDDGSLVTGSPERNIEGDFDDPEVGPSVGFTGDAYVVTYSDEVQIGPGNYDVYVKTVDPWTVEIVETESVVASGIPSQSNCNVAGGWAGAATPTHRALLAWQEFDNVLDQTDIWAHLFETEESLVTELGGGCGDGGSAVASNAFVGNDEFEHTLTGADDFSLAFLLMAFERLDYPCGSCTLVPNPFEGYVFGGFLTDGLGYASVSMPIPNNPTLDGLEFIDQWAIFTLSPACTDFAADLSTAIEVELQ